MVILEKDELSFRFPDVHEDACCQVCFQQTLRVPDDGKDYPLPPDFGPFRIHVVDDYVERLPADWKAHGGVFLALYQCEAMWIHFKGTYPCAIKVGAGKVNVLTGTPWHPALGVEEQDYVVVPNQPWMDGFHMDEGRVRQFVAMPLGKGATAEELLTGVAEHGGLQVAVYPMKQPVYEELRRKRDEERRAREKLAKESRLASSPDIRFSMRMPDDRRLAMGMMPGGIMRQVILADPFGVDSWDQEHPSRCFVHVLNTHQYASVTGKPPPHWQFTAELYAYHGLPWFFRRETGPSLLRTKGMAVLERLATLFKKQNDLLDSPSSRLGPMPLREGESRQIREGQS